MANLEEVVIILSQKILPKILLSSLSLIIVCQASVEVLDAVWQINCNNS